MPELPELEALARYLDNQLAHRRVQRVDLAAISALKTFDPPVAALAGNEVGSVGRRGKYLLFDCAERDPMWLVAHLARGGWVRWRGETTGRRARPGKGPLALRMVMEGGGEVDFTEAGTEKRLAIWVVHDPCEVEQVAALGPEPLESSFDREALARVLSGQAGQIKHVITDQEVVAGIGNAYSDEILHAARLSPFKAANRLSDEELDRLYAATVGTLRDAVERSIGLPASQLKDNKRSGMRVHGRKGEPCPVCGTAVREVAYSGKSLQYCPGCQTGGKVLADRRLSRLLR